jgi:crotonobetainyl-CoA:carnitine CoA-transferase CaiB-like acyl-CoA transferase
VTIVHQLLSDFRVVEFSQEPAGAYCGKVFADLGARVVKVEAAGADPMRTRPGAFAHLNTNKSSVVVDPPAPDETTLRRLLERADLIIESPGQGGLEAFDLDCDSLRDAFPVLVVTSISGFGGRGPYAGYRWSDLVAQTVALATLPQGGVDTMPVKLPGIVGLCSVGQTAALGALAALELARRTGSGAHVDCAAYEALGTIPARVARFLGWEYLGRTPPPPPASTTSDTLIPLGVFPCADGYVSLMSTPQQLQEMLTVLDDAALWEAFSHPDAFVRGETKEALDSALYPWLLSHTRAEATALAQAAGWPFAGVNTPREVLDADHLHQRGFWVDALDPAVGQILVPGPPYRMSEGGWRLRRPAPDQGCDQRGASNVHAVPAVGPGPRRDDDLAPLSLDGIRVLDLTTVWSGPYVTQLLADLGAEVVRVENPSVFPPTTKGYTPRPAPDMELGALLNMYAPWQEGQIDRPYNRHGMNNSIARNKLSCTLDPRRPEAFDLLLRLVEKSDVFVENLKTSTLHRLGIHESVLLDRNPRLVILRIPPAGLTGDWAGYTGFGAQFDGLSGFAYLAGHFGTELVETPSTMYMDAATGPAGAFAVLAALHYREATGRGQVIELAQMENALNHLGDIFVDSQRGIEPHRLGNRDPLLAPQGIYPCRGPRRWIGITVIDNEQWAALCTLIGKPELALDARYATSQDRFAHEDELDALISAWTSAQDLLEAFHTLQAAGIPAGPQLDNDLLASDPHVRARDWLRPLTATETGTHLHVGHAFQGIPQAWRRGSPSLGEDNEYIYRKVIGLSDEEYQRLVAAKVIVNDYLDASGEPV